MKQKIIVKGPVLSQSGYGEQARFALRALRTKEDLFDIFIVPIAWGQTGWVWEVSEFRQWMDQRILETQLKLQEKSLDQNKEIKQLKLAVDELTENDKYRILHIAQLQEDLNQLKSFKDILKKQQLQISNLVDMLLHASL